MIIGLQNLFHWIKPEIQKVRTEHQKVRTELSNPNNEQSLYNGMD